MNDAPELVQVTSRVYAAMNASDIETIRELFVDSATTSVIGTDPAEWWVGYDTLMRVFAVQVDELRGWRWEPTELVAYCSGDVGWATDRAHVTLPAGNTVTIRSSMVYTLVRAHWKIAHWHVSIGTNNEESLGLELTTSVEALADAFERDRPNVAGAAGTDGTVTLLFSDIEGSTALLESLGDRGYMELLRWHNRVVRDGIDAWDGFEVGREGDSFMIAFGSARRALRCALDVQARLAAGPPDGMPEVRVRMGAHTGETIRDADEFYGHAVHFAARVSSAASGGEILASQVVRDLNAGCDDFFFESPRTLEFKGFTGEHAVYPVVAASR